MATSDGPTQRRTRADADARGVARLLGLPKKKLPIIKKAIQIHNATPQSDQSDTGWSLGEMVMDERLKSPDEETARSRCHENSTRVAFNPRC